MNCPKCNYPNDSRNKFCQNCGTPLPQNINNQKSGGSGLAKASLIFGIAGLVLTFVVIGVAPAIIGLILGMIAIAMNKPQKGMSIVGILISVMALMIFLILVISTRDYNNNKNEEDKAMEDELSQHFSVNEEVANTSDITEEEYKNLCKEYSYDEIVRTPDNYKEKYCKLTGTVSQSVEGWFGQYTIYISDMNGNIWGCTYSYDNGEAHMLEGDQVTVYGILDGTTTSETVLGKQVEMPYLYIEYR